MIQSPSNGEKSNKILEYNASCTEGEKNPVHFDSIPLDWIERIEEFSQKFNGRKSSSLKPCTSRQRYISGEGKSHIYSCFSFLSFSASFFSSSLSSQEHFTNKRRKFAWKTSSVHLTILSQKYGFERDTSIT